MNELLIPYLNPLKFHKKTPVEIAQYASKHMDDWWFVDTIHSWEQPVRYCQPWLKSDSIRLQFISNYSPLTLYLKDEKGRNVFNWTFDTRQQDEFRPTYYIRQSDSDLAAFDEGNYYFQINDSHVSDPIKILESYPNSLLLEYSHPIKYGDVWFGSPFNPSIRVPAILKYKNPADSSYVYTDQQYNETILKSIPYRVWRFILGGQGGVPPWLIDKISRIFGCQNVKIDGRYYTKPSGSQFEPTEVDGYPMAGWGVDLREKLNRDSLIFQDEVQIAGTANMMQVVDTKGFGINDNSSGDFLEILNVE